MNIKQLFPYILFFFPILTYGQKVIPTYDQNTGGVTKIMIENDPYQMNWILAADETQYHWIGKSYQWGLGTLNIVDGGKTQMARWTQAEKVESNKAIYDLDSKVKLTVIRYHDGNDYIEEYEFKNISGRDLELSEIDINTPFNDNYPDASTCMTNRTHAHIWAGGNGAYVNAMRMGYIAPHLGLMCTEGAITGYATKENVNEGKSNLRGVICLRPENRKLKKDESFKIAWRLFAHQGNDDFYSLLKQKGGIKASSPKYVYTIGETATVYFEQENKLKNAKIYAQGKQLSSSIEGNTLIGKFPIKNTGTITIECQYEGGKHTKIELWGISDIENLMNKRAEFIIEKQQYDDTTNPRYGAYLPYDNETGEIYLNFKAEPKRADLNEGAERVGMGVFLAKMYQRNKDSKIKESLIKYAHFLRTRLQKENYETWSVIERSGRHRTYNYPWVASFYFEMFEVTGKQHFIYDGYQTLRAFYRSFGANTNTFDTPVEQSIILLRANGFEAEADTLLTDYRKVADVYIKNGANIPKSEVNYEQGNIAASIIFLEQMYLLTQESQYLETVNLLMPILEAFNGQQPSFHLNGIAIRHWDGFWFGKYRYWGDTMPHYWSVLSADAFAYYARCTGDQAYADRAKNILLNNLCLFGEDGSASCAYIYPDRANGKKTGLFDPMANDQDWTLVFYLKWEKNI